MAGQLAPVPVRSRPGAHRPTIESSDWRRRVVVRVSEGSTPGSRLALTPEQLSGLRAAFAQEVTARLGPLRDAAARLGDSGDLQSARIVMQHAHTLASSAVILGEQLAAYHASRCEQALLPYLEEAGDSSAGTVPIAAAREAAAEAGILGVLLGPWLLGAADSVH